MTDQVLKLMAYFGLLFVILYAVLSALGKRSQVSTAPPRPRPKANGSVWSQYSVPAAATQQAGSALPNGPV